MITEYFVVKKLLYDTNEDPVEYLVPSGLLQGGCYKSNSCSQATLTSDAGDVTVVVNKHFANVGLASERIGQAHQEMAHIT